VLSGQSRILTGQRRRRRRWDSVVAGMPVLRLISACRTSSSTSRCAIRATCRCPRRWPVRRHRLGSTPCPGGHVHRCGHGSHEAAPGAAPHPSSPPGHSQGRGEFPGRGGPSCLPEPAGGQQSDAGTPATRATGQRTTRSLAVPRCRDAVPIPSMGAQGAFPLSAFVTQQRFAVLVDVELRPTAVAVTVTRRERTVGQRRGTVTAFVPTGSVAHPWPRPMP
jgi:hypothetical protein